MGEPRNRGAVPGHWGQGHGCRFRGSCESVLLAPVISRQRLTPPGEVFFVGEDHDEDSRNGVIPLQLRNTQHRSIAASSPAERERSER
jgi:hypothetical protein